MSLIGANVVLMRLRMRMLHWAGFAGLTLGPNKICGGVISYLSNKATQFLGV